MDPLVVESQKRVKSLAASVPSTTPPPNVPRSFHTALRSLRNDPGIVIKPADKGSGTVILDREDYVYEALRQLEDPSTYRPLTEPIYPETAKKITKILLSLEDQGYLKPDQVDFLTPPPEPRPRRFYLLPKIHKPTSKWTVPGRIPPGRPVISDCSSESYEVAQYIDSFLLPLSMTHPAYVKDSFDFLRKIRSIQVPADCLLVTCDVSSMYTNIQNEPGIQSIANIFEANPDHARPDKEILELLRLNLECNDFEFDGQFFLQISGTAMGKTFSPSYADIFMAQWEREALADWPDPPLLYLRYRDDIFMIWQYSRERLQEFISFLNSRDPSIQLTHEVSSESQDYLDITVFKGPSLQTSGHLDTKVYFKPTDTHQLLHRLSFHPPHTFQGLVKSQFLRFWRLCSQQTDFHKACQTLMLALEPRGYARRFLRMVKHRLLEQVTRPPPIPLTHSLYISDTHGQMLQRCQKMTPQHLT